MSKKAKKDKPINKVVTTKKNQNPKYRIQNPKLFLPGVILLLICIIFYNFITADVYYLFKDIGSDTLNLVYPNLIGLSKYLRTEGFPFWSFNPGMGQEIMSVSLSDPFLFFLVLLNKPENIAYGMFCIELIKIIITSFFIYKFLKLWKLTPTVIIIGVILYSFSGFMILGGQMTIHSTEVCYLAILLFSFEKLYLQNRWYWFPLAIALISILRPVDLYFYGLFLFIYFMFRHFLFKINNWKKLYQTIIKIILCSILGIAISSFVSVGIINLMLDSSRVSGDSSYFNILSSKPVFFTEESLHYTTAILRFFSNDMLGDGIDYKGWSNYYEAPLFYIGLLPLLLIPQTFINADKRKRIVYILFIFIFLLPVVFPYFRYAYWIFSGDYYRSFSFFVALAILIPALFVLNDFETVKKINLPLLIGSLIGLIILLYFPYKNAESIVNKNIQTMVTIFLIVYTLIILILRTSGFRNLTIIFLVLTVFVEIAYFNYNAFKKRDVMTKKEFKEKKGYNDYTLEAVNYINSIDKQFFRTNKEYTSNYTIHTSFNDAEIQGYNGTMSYLSFNQKYYIRFLQEMGIFNKGDKIQNRWTVGLIKRPFLLTLASNKYELTKEPKSMLTEIGYDSIAKFNDVLVLKNKNFLPLGFTYDSYLPLKDFSKQTPLMKDLIMLKAFVTEEKNQINLNKLKRLQINDKMLDYSIEDYVRDISSLKQDTLNITYFSQSKIKGNITLKSPKMLFFSIPYDKGWNALVDNQKIKPVLCNIGFISLFLEAGQHNIQLYYRPPYFYLTLIISIISLLIYISLIMYHKFWKKIPKS